MENEHNIKYLLSEQQGEHIWFCKCGKQFNSFRNLKNHINRKRQKMRNKELNKIKKDIWIRRHKRFPHLIEIDIVYKLLANYHAKMDCEKCRIRKREGEYQFPIKE